MQLQLDFPLHPTLQKLSIERSKLRLGNTAQATQDGYNYDWKVFRTWCDQMGRGHLPASPETLSLYVTDLLAKGKKVSTAERRLYGALYFHRLEGLERPSTKEAEAILNGAQRIRGEQPRQMTPLTVGELAAIAKVLRQKGTPLAIRDCSILVLGFASALRRANISGLLLEDVGFCDEGLTIHVRREKQDQRSKGRSIGLPRSEGSATCPRATLESWLSLRGSGNGPLFTRLDATRPSRLSPLSTNAIWIIVKRAVAAIGLDPSRYGGHSLRAGFVTAAFERGVGEIRIANHTGHRSLSTLRRYVRPADLFRFNACSALGL